MKSRHDERWKSVTHLPGLMISDHGRYRRIYLSGFRKQQVWTPKPNKVNKRCYVKYKNKTYQISRLVAMLFVKKNNKLKGVEFNKLEVDHVDNTRPWYNHYKNLRWVDMSTNRKNRRQFIFTNTVKIRARKQNVHEWIQLDELLYSKPKLNISQVVVKRLLKEKDSVEYKGWVFEKYKECQNIKGELWKPARWKGKFLHGVNVSNLGRIKKQKIGTKRTNEAWTPKPQARGTAYARIWINSKLIQFHQIICETFNGPCPFESWTVDHIDRNPQNNKSCNLRWLSKSGQNKNKAKTSNSSGDMTGIAIKARGTGESKWSYFQSQTECAKILGIHRRSIYNCLLGRQKSVCGYEFQILLK